MAKGPNRSSQLEIRVVSSHGLHMRPAGALARALQKCRCTVTAELDGKSANAKSISELVMLEAGQGSVLRLAFTGDDAEHCRSAASELGIEELELA